MKYSREFGYQFFVIGLALALITWGCGAGFYSASTTAVYEITNDGKRVSYTSNKEQQGLELDLIEKDGKVEKLKIRVDKATTVESAVAAAAASTMALIEAVKELASVMAKMPKPIP